MNTRNGFLNESSSSESSESDNDHNETSEEESRILPVRDSDQEESEAELALDEADAAEKKGRGPNKDYQHLAVFEDLKTALKSMSDNYPSYKFRCIKDSVEGDKHFFHCKGNRSCPKQMYALLHAENDDVSIWVSEDDHLHSGKAGLDPRSVKIVAQCMRDNIKSNRLILAKIAEARSGQITKSQLKNLKMRLKNQAVGRSDAKLHDLIEWCTENRAIPTDPNELFCGGLDYELDEFDELTDLADFSNNNTTSFVNQTQ
jgi:hypothetical protein